MANGKPPRLMLEQNELLFSFPSISRLAKLKIGFQRTLRVPDDGRDYPLPAGLGLFPLERVEDSSLPDHWQRRGGVYLPMYSSEAMWISLESEFPMAVKVAAGKINAVSGELWSEELESDRQDYVVAGEQPWIDGFNVGSDRVRQFVATRLGQGRSVEEQATGEATWGGIQLLVFPMKSEQWKAIRKKRSRQRFKVRPLAAAAPMGLGFGGMIRQSIERDPWGRDAWDVTQRLRVFVSLLHSKDYPCSSGRPAPTTPITPSMYQQYQIPWFEYDYSGDGVEPMSNLANVSSVSDGLGREGVTQLGDRPITVSDVIHLPTRRVSRRP